MGDAEQGHDMPTGAQGLQRALAPVGLALFTVLTALLAFVAVDQQGVEAAGLWPHAYFLAIAAQWGALGVAAVGLTVQGAEPWLRVHGRVLPKGRGPALVALILFHILVAVASVFMGFADALVGGRKLPGYLVELLPREGQLLMLLGVMWALLVVATSFLWLYHRLAPRPVRHHAILVTGTLFTGAVAYWGWGWSRFYATFPGEWFSLWKVGALDIAVEGTIFRFLLVALPLAHSCVVAWLAWQLLRGPRQRIAARISAASGAAARASGMAPAEADAPPGKGPSPGGSDTPS